MKTLLSSLATALAFTAWAPCTFAQNLKGTPSDCEVGAKAITDVAALRRAGQTRENVKGFLKMASPEREKHKAMDTIVDRVYDESISSLDTLPRRVLDVCTGKVSARKVVPPQVIDATLKRLRVVHDKMTGIRWYFHPTSPRSHDSNGFYLYFGRTETGQFSVIHLVSRYYGSNWLFVKDAWVLANGQRVTVPQYSTVLGAEWQRDHADGNVWEEYDSELIRTADIASVRKVAESRDVAIRFEGRKYIGDRTVSAQQLIAMRGMIQTYEAVTGSEWK